MISVFSKTAKTEKELAGVGYPILDRWAKSATLKAALNGEQHITVTIPHKAEGVKRDLIPSEFDILKIQDMEDEDDYYRIGKPRYTLNSTILTAEHISYDLIDNIIEDINIVGLDGQQAMDRISQGTQYSHPFLLRSNIRHTANIRMVRMNPMQALIGNADNTFINRYGGELRRRRFTLTINDRIGVDRTEVIRSKKNLNGFERDIDIDSIVTRIMPKAENGILLPEKYVDSPLIGNYPHPKIRVIEYKTGYEGEFKELPNSEKQAVYQKLRQFAKAEFKNGIDKPRATYKVSFVPLSKTKEYESYRFMEAINLGDKVGVYEESYDVYIEARVVEIEWDILNKKYISITLGSFQDSLTKSSVSQNSSTASQIQDVKETANLAMASADGKTTNFYGFDEPSNPRPGDTWFKRNGEETEIWQYEEVDGVPMWVYKVGPQHAKDIEQRLNAQISDINDQIERSNTEHNRKIAESLQKAGASQSLAEEAKRLSGEASSAAKEAIRNLSQSAQELSKYKQDNEQNLAVLRTQTQQANNTAKQASTTAQQTAESMRTELVRVEQRITDDVSKAKSLIPKHFSNPNLLKNSSLTKELSGWEANGYVSVNPKGWTEINAKFGSTSYFTQNILDEIKQDAVDTEYTASIDVKLEGYSSRAGGFSLIYLSGYYSKDGVRTWFAPSYINSNSLIDEKFGYFSRKSVSFKIDIPRKLIESFSISVYTNDVQGRIILKNFKLEKGRLATPWIPHIKDFANELEVVRTQINKTADGLETKISRLTSDLNGKVSSAEFQKVRETAQLYERVLGSTQDGITSNISRMALTSDLFNIEVGKMFLNLTNIVYAPTKLPKYISSVSTENHLERVSWGDHDGIRINYTKNMSGWLGVRFPLTKKIVTKGEVLGYRIEIAVDSVPESGAVLIQLLDNTTNLGMYYNNQIRLTKTGNQVFTGYIDVPRTGELNEYSLRFTLTRPGNIVIHKPMIVDGRSIPAQFVDSTDYNSEYTRTTMSLLKDSFAVKTLNSHGDVLSSINLATGGASLQVGNNKLVVTPNTTYIANGTIKSAMIDSLDAGKITAGILDASKARLVNVDASSITSGSLSANFVRGGLLTAINGNSVFDLNNGRIEMRSNPYSWRTSWDSNGIAFRGPGNDIWGAMGGDSGGGVGIYMRYNHAFNIVVNHSDDGRTTSYTPIRVQYGEGTILQFSPGGPSYNLLLLLNNIYENIRMLHEYKESAVDYTYSMYGPLK